MAPSLEHIYLSPHLDDAVFSCGGTMAAQRARGERVRVVTVCAGLPPQDAPPPLLLRDGLRAAGLTTTELVSLRREEDRRALSLLDVECEWAGGLDAIYRLPETYGTFAGLTGPIAARDPLVQVALEIASSVPSSSVLYAPLGAGEHVDHRIVCEAAMQVGRRVLFYEDFPYVARDPDAVSRRFRSLGVVMDSLLTDVSATLERRITATLCYVSQVGEAARMAELLRSHALRVGNGTPHERVFAKG
jgi:LmbE family N-acetylglucosaminyl deacetylase